MKKNIKFMSKIVVLSMLFIALIGARSFAAEPINPDNLDFTNIPENGTSTSTSSGTTTTTTTTTTDNKTTNTTANTTNTTKNTTTNTTSTSSASKEKMPATGSNVEIIFVVGSIVLVSGAIFLFRKQNIKLK